MVIIINHNINKKKYNQKPFLSAPNCAWGII